MCSVPLPDVHAPAGAKFGIVASLLARSPCCPSLDGTSMDPTVHFFFLFWVCSRHDSALDAVPVLFGWLGTMADPWPCSLHLTRGPWNRFGTLETKGRTFIRRTSSEFHLPFFSDTSTVRSPVGNARSTTIVACTWGRNEVHWSDHGCIWFDDWHLACLLRHVRILAFDSCVRTPCCPRCTAWLCPCAMAHLSTTPDTTVHNGLQRFTTRTQPKPTRTRETSSQRFTTDLSSSSIHPLDCLANSPCVLLVHPRRAGALLLVFPCTCALQQHYQHRLAHVQLVVSSTDERGRDPTFCRRILLNHQCPPFQLLPIPRQSSRPWDGSKLTSRAPLYESFFSDGWGSSLVAPPSSNTTRHNETQPDTTLAAGGTAATSSSHRPPRAATASCCLDSNET